MSSLPLSRSFFAAAVSAFVMLTGPSAQAQTTDLPDYVIAEFGTPPAIPIGALDADLQSAVNRLVRISLDQNSWDPSDTGDFTTLMASEDPRVVWILTDMLRFTWRPEFGAQLIDASTTLMGIDRLEIQHSSELIDYMMAWDMPPYPDYLDNKRAVFTNYIDGWEDIFVEGDIDWHLVQWGGVNIDARPFGRTDEPCNCIPAADDPEVSTAQEATWLSDDAIVFGITINGESRAYPRRIMEVREMVNDTLGGRDLGIPYCTLCGAMQAYFTDELPVGVERPVLRTSGLLIRSNKVMYDITSGSVFDTFLGHAVTGPLADIDLQLDQATVITTDWGTWKETHPDTTVLVESLALGRDFDFRNGRDANGPIFPVGDVDPRLPVQEDVIGVLTASGTPVAFQRSTAMVALQNGQTIAFENVHLELDAGGIRAVGDQGEDVGSHQAFWFAWSQFHPETELWAR
ncbi:Protein of unknown function [Octadecabacter temperatus]|uniref:Uncharacterized protein n=1 Tax=Octadecabacter temperatus TaxID=1458307 RepID=A0A0K0Y1J9_9RHOB|nr:DUF3179 domain-containing (seleno)protein [Octadecabacter temperatus]AKS44818.1 hypothetical protein OSB_02500 [Octadecabacter temperatus]SIO34914.1 Protein of unknown function [Octadecabacter temperatus]